MSIVSEPLPHSPVDPVTEILHGIPVVDPYRWLEDQDSPRTRRWLEEQTRYARAYLDSIPGRDQIRKRIRELLDVETYDSVQKVGNRYFFRKRLPGQEQPAIYFREGIDGEDQLLVDPARRGTGPHTAVKPLSVSQGGRLLIYEVKQGGERSGQFELLDVATREQLPDRLPHGYLRGFAFAPDSRAFCYVHEPLNREPKDCHVAYKHFLGTSFDEDQKVFFADYDRDLQVYIIPGGVLIGFLVIRSRDVTLTDFHVGTIDGGNDCECLIKDAPYTFSPVLLSSGRILAMTNAGAPNFRIVELSRTQETTPKLVDVVAETDLPIQTWTVARDHIFVSYLREIEPETRIFDFFGKQLGQVPHEKRHTVRMVTACHTQNELLFEEESFTSPIQICTYDSDSDTRAVWARREVPFDPDKFAHIQAWYSSRDGVKIPIFLVGRKEVIESGPRPTIMTSYGGYGASMTPQFSAFVAFLMERGCLFALPNIRGGSEFGRAWHEAGKRRNRQVAIDDFIASAEWLIETRRTEVGNLAIFGGSNSGLLVAAAMTQRPDLFRAVVCMVPLLDMLRYHLFDHARAWQSEFGTADNYEDLSVLSRYSPYHNVREGNRYPATMIVSGDRDQSCNPLHARKMTARLQAANGSRNPIFLDYSPHRGHSPVLPISERIEALTDRMAFLCDQLGL